jgi:beta-galactosidase
MKRAPLFLALVACALFSVNTVNAVPQSGAKSAATPAAAKPAPAHVFALGKDDFLLDGKPFQIISCEMHPARIPVEYWAQRIQMAKAMGCNTVAAYIFWNYHETQEGVFDFTTTNHDLPKFFRLVKDAGMWAILRPGPYGCAEWDFGGIPSYLLKDPELRVRGMYPRYMKAAERYMAQLARVLMPSLVTRGGPVLLLQVENEYGSYANDRNYMSRLRDVWKLNGIDIPFFTGDGPTPYMLEAGSLPGAAIGLDSGSDEKHWTLARSINPGVPIFSSETYPGWLTHWGEKWQRPGIPNLIKEVTWLLDNKKSFNFYVAHGGTNFGFTAGANSGGKGYEPDVTSYDYDAPIDEQGRATPKYMALRELIGRYLPAGTSLPPIPPPVPTMSIGEFEMTPMTSVWDQLPAPIKFVHPRPFEYYGQNQGLVLYRTTLIGRKSGKLVITDLHDYAQVLVDGKLIGTIDRRLGEKSIDIPASPAGSAAAPVLDVLVEGTGHINFAQEIIDRKGITDRVTLSGMTLTNWDVFLLPLSDRWIGTIASKPTSTAMTSGKPGVLFKGTFTLESVADTYVDMSGYRKGVVWVNGHNLGRYWDIGPQTKLYCPASWLVKGRNTVVVLDLHKTEASPLRGSEHPQ